MKSLAELKRRMTAGTTVRVVNHVYPELSGDRLILKAQTARWCLRLPEGHPRYVENDGSWLNVPKASRITFDGDAATIHRDPETDSTGPGPFCTITFP